jgi:hypothetical protein
MFLNPNVTRDQLTQMEKARAALIQAQQALQAAMKDKK